MDSEPPSFYHPIDDEDQRQENRKIDGIKKQVLGDFTASIAQQLHVYNRFGQFGEEFARWID